MVGVGDLLGDDNPTLCHMGIISYAIIRIPSLNNQGFFRGSRVFVMNCFVRLVARVEFYLPYVFFLFRELKKIS